MDLQQIAEMISQMGTKIDTNQEDMKTSQAKADADRKRMEENQAKAEAEMKATKKYRSHYESRQGRKEGRD
jgi:DNA repair ATPase RecN